MPRQPIIFDFTTGRAQRGRPGDIATVMKGRVAMSQRKKVVKRVEGLPPHVVNQPKP